MAASICLFVNRLFALDVRLMIKNIHKAMKILFDPIPNLTSVESDHSAKPDHMSKSYVSSKPACLPNPVNSEKPVSNRSGGYQGQGYRGNQDRGNKIPKNIATDRGYASNQQKGQYQVGSALIPYYLL